MGKETIQALASARTLVSTLPPDLALLERSRSHHNSQHPPHLLHSRLRERFGQDISRHAFGGNVLHVNNTCLDHIPEAV